MSDGRAAEPILVEAVVMAEMLSISESKLALDARKGVIPSVKIGRRRLYMPDAVREHMRCRMQNGGE